MSQHPDWVLFSRAFHEGRFDDALTLVDGLLREYPDEYWLHWHRAACLEKLERFDAIEAALDRALELEPDFVRAIVMRARYAGFDDLPPDEGWDDNDEPTPEQRAFDARAEARLLQSIDALRRALVLEPDNVDALQLLSERLGAHPQAAAHVAEARALLDRAIELAPDRVALVEQRAALRRGDAMRPAEDAPGADLIENAFGMRYARSGLEAALADYERCLALDGHHRHALRAANLLHDLGRFDEALARYDEALVRMPADDPARAMVLEMRERSEDGGTGERRQMARLLEAAAVGEGQDRTLEEDMAAQAMLGAARAIRAGRSLEEAIEANISDDPDAMLAANIARQILGVAHEPAPGLVAVEAADYPKYQRRMVDRVARAAGEIDLVHAGDGEATGMFPMLGQHVLIRFFSGADGGIGVAAFVLRPKWPGWIGFLLMLLTGKWRKHEMIEAVTHFDDGTLLSTQTENVSPFEFGGAIRIERMPRGTPLARLVEHHRDRAASYQSAHPGAKPIRAHDLEGFEARWIAGQQAKGAYRKSVGYVTESELRKLLGGMHDRFAAKIRTQIERLAPDYG